MPKIHRFVTTPHINDTGTCSFKFMFDGDMPRSWVGHGHYYGMLIPFPEEHGQDTKAYIFESGRGQVLSGAFLARDPANDAYFKDIFDLEFEVIFLVTRDVFDKIEAALKALGIEVLVHHCAHDLATA